MYNIYNIDISERLKNTREIVISNQSASLRAFPWNKINLILSISLVTAI